jgi:hypothetical protein
MRFRALAMALADSLLCGVAQFDVIQQNAIEGEGTGWTV